MTEGWESGEVFFPHLGASGAEAKRIIRKMSGDYCWALPYWNWNSPNERRLPEMFRDTTSELFTPNRRQPMNDGSGSLPGTDVDYGAAFAFSDFTNASSSLEGTPHGAVHVDVGGWMGSVPTAAQDPIFYLHHANIDRLWNLWLVQGAGRADPLADVSWKDTKFTFFDENGCEIGMTGCEVLRAAQQLNYTYEGEPGQINEFCPPQFKLPPIFFEQMVLMHLPLQEIILTSEPVSIGLDIQPIRQRLETIVASGTEKLLLELEDVETERQPGVVWSIFVGLPSGAEPDPKSPHYVGNLAMFGTGIRSEAHHGFKPARFAFVITRAIQASLEAGEERVPVTFIPYGILIDGKLSHPKPEPPVRIGRVNISVQTEKHQ